MHTSQCLSPVATIATLVLPRRGMVDPSGRETLDFGATGPYARSVVLELKERHGAVIVGRGAVIVRVSYGTPLRDTGDREHVRLHLDLGAGPVRLVAPDDATCQIATIDGAFDAWLDDLAALGPGGVT